jgi:hypothetical protein
MNKKEIQRDQRFEIRMSKEEKDLWMKYAEDMGINPTRLARNLLMMEAENIINKYFSKNVVKSYIKYCEVTKNKEVLDRIKDKKVLIEISDTINRILND